jgi:hypothetical protein
MPNLITFELALTLTINTLGILRPSRIYRLRPAIRNSTYTFLLGLNGDPPLVLAPKVHVKLLQIWGKWGKWGGWAAELRRMNLREDALATSKAAQLNTSCQCVWIGFYSCEFSGREREPGYN